MEPRGRRLTAPRRRRVHGAALGILMLDNAFQRLPGDIGHAGSFDFPVLYHVVEGVDTERVVFGDPEEVLAAFLRGAEHLAAMGADGIGTSCGKLAALHPRLVARSPVPFVTSSLQQVPLVAALLPAGRRVGVITSNAAALTPAHFAGVGVPADLPLAELPEGGVFRRNMRENAPVCDYAGQEADVFAAADALLAGNPDVGALVLECANLAPYSAALATRHGLPVYDVVTLLAWFHAGLSPRRFT